ncbi:hypothetical protein AVEN_48505-1 [Araneus ventricosus]|uniref:Uncharacterized protein n=1 Tax=Araneus ventricosus TaxID=182803 RepID=A0A4Y2RLV3_ARAVE|nr:hypothetical protein AVEN_48505-1 [Araneus ventricosus]
MIRERQMPELSRRRRHGAVDIMSATALHENMNCATKTFCAHAAVYRVNSSGVTTSPSRINHRAAYARRQARAASAAACRHLPVHFAPCRSERSLSPAAAASLKSARQRAQR